MRISVSYVTPLSPGGFLFPKLSYPDQNKVKDVKKNHCFLLPLPVLEPLLANWPQVLGGDGAKSQSGCKRREFVPIPQVATLSW